MLVALRTCDANMQSRGGFQWPGVGETVTAPDWTDNQECGGGLHGLLWGQGDWSLLARDETARWVVFKPLGEMSHLGAKIKCESAEVLFAGARLDAWQFLRQHVTNLQGANLQGADLRDALYAFASVTFLGHGERGRALTAMRRKEGDAPELTCGCFSGNAKALREYIANGPERYRATRTLALDTVLLLLDARNPEAEG